MRSPNETYFFSIISTFLGTLSLSLFYYFLLFKGKLSFCRGFFKFLLSDWFAMLLFNVGSCIVCHLSVFLGASALLYLYLML